MKIIIVLLLVYQINFLNVNAQDCEQLLKAKIEQYFFNVKNKPDSLSFITCKLIRQRLMPGEIFLDFTSTQLNDQDIFFETIIKKNEEDQIIVIPQLPASISETRINEKERGVSVKNVNYNDYYQYENLSKYITPYLGDVKTIYYSTSGNLNLVNLKYLKTKEGSSMFQKYNMVRLHTAASFLNNHKQLILDGPLNVLLIGGVFYDCDTAINKQISNRNYWNYLPATKIEIDTIASILRNKNHVTILDSCKATESKLLSAIKNKKYEILHLATHGFYIDSSDKELGVSSNSYSLYKSGIVLSGANNPNATVEPFDTLGLFTAFEFFKLNLSNIKLIVLSTCNSGEGYSIQSGAPYGLILTLLRQGANALIVSNREVNDTDTKNFMIIFYGYLSKKSNVDECFINTLRYLSQKFPRTNWDFFDLVH